MDSRGRSRDQPIDDEARRQQTGCRLAETERVGGDERLALLIGGEERRVRERDREGLAAIREKGQAISSRSLPVTPDPRMKPGTDEATASTSSGWRPASDHGEFSSPTDPGQRDRQPGMLPSQRLQPLDQVENQPSRRSGMAPIALIGAGTTPVGK